MVTSETREKIRKDVSNIIVIPLNMDAINKDVDKSVKENAKKAGDSSFAPQIAENEYFGLRGKLSVIKGTNIIIDDECVGEDGPIVAIEIYPEKRDDEGKVTGFGMFPQFSSKTTIEALLAEYATDEVSLEAFMGNRFCYNPSICSNIREIIKSVKN